jgi:EAL domain-containing protein (putative c-di-GMP-specific phosphodiesterase class I)/PleD family two-component response regulator
MSASPIARRNPAAAASGIDTPARAECPPPHYWRRWSSDAPEGAMSPSHPATSHAPTDHDTSSTADAPGEAPYRVLVVEDDASQALFAESVLKGAGIQAQVASDHIHMMAAMEQFHPDLVLMDLHLPGCSGIELTASIRAHPAFLHTPVVFLTGDQDPDRQFEVLESGADDFLSKPIKPRHLIAAVQSRIKRARALQRQRFDGANRHPVTGLHTRPYLLQRIAAAIGAGSGGGALFVELQNATALRERYGYAGFEQLMLEAGKRIGELAGACPGARLNDNAFLVFAPESAQALEVFARRLRDGIRTSTFDVAGVPQQLGSAIGYSALDHGFADAGSVLDAVEQAARAARTEPTSLSPWQPPEPGNDPSSSLADALRAGLHDDAFELLFQPIVAVAGGDEAQFQVLLRMRDADGVVHNAGQLVPVAEEAGLMPDIDRWVLQQAIDLLHRKRGEQRPLRLFVSQSPRTLARDLHGAWLQEMLESHGIDGPSLVIDLRMDDALVHSITLRRFCEQLMPIGVQFCLSQYAQDSEADALLQQLPLGYVRLSPRYSHAHADAQLRDELRGAIDRAHRLGLQVIGPQVEDAQGAATLWMSGIDFIQGNLVQQALGELDFDFQHSVL